MRLLFDLIRFWGVGTVSVTVHFLVLYTLVGQLDLNPTLSSAFSFAVACTVNYLLLYHWAFLADGKHKIVVAKYVFVMSLSMILNVFIFWLLTEQSGIWYIYSQGVATICSSLFSFGFNRHYTFV